MTDNRLLIVVMDGIGHNPDSFGNAVKAATTPVMNFLAQKSLFTTLKAHGTAVGLPSDGDMGNSEVGHNALGAGRVFAQGAKLVEAAINSGSLFRDQPWQDMMSFLKESSGNLHLLGLLSDGNVHSHERHLFALIKQAKQSGVKKVFVHALFDGRDVPNGSAEVYLQRLQALFQEVNDGGFNAAVASGGGRMHVTMDRYEADWKIVERGWQTHVLGHAAQYPTANAALADLRSKGNDDDQFLPPFVVSKDQKPIGAIVDGDAVVMFNFRGDRAIEISRAFTEESFAVFDRQRVPKVFYAGMMEYDGDLKIPQRYLVNPPRINGTLGELLAAKKLRQFACSETQKFGHVTYFWNGNRSGYIDKNTEEYVEIPSDNIIFNLRPWMKAEEIATATIERIQRQSFDVGRINFANGDMVGHTGDYDAAVLAVQTVDLMLGRIVNACQKNGTMLLVTADHGNADQMFEKGTEKEFPQWQSWPAVKRPQAKTSHTLCKVPFYFYDPQQRFVLTDVVRSETHQPSIAHIAATTLAAMGLPENGEYLPSLIQAKK